MVGSTRNLTPQTPGEEPQPDTAQAEQTAPEAEQISENTEQPTTKEADDSSPAASVDPKDDEIAALRSELARCYSAMNRAGVPLPSANPAARDDGLPDSDSIDHNAITSPVLTKQGWLMPKGS